MYTISQLFIYPIKSLGGFEVLSAYLTDRGFQYDRRFMLVDINGNFLTQREHATMCLLQTSIINDQLIVYPRNSPADNLKLSLKPETNLNLKVKIWDDECDARRVSDAADEWFSNKLSMQCQLVYMPENERRKVDEHYAHDNEITSFSDAYPLMMIGQASLDDLNNRLDEPLPMNRFRPSIVFTGGAPYDEDQMEQIRINGIDLYGVKLCARCVVPTIDQTTATKAKEPSKTLATYRMANNKIYFGQNMIHKKTGVISTGDGIERISSKQAMEFDEIE